VLLFDEIEKAHADVFNILLQVLDDGRLTDGHGRTVDFKNTVIIMTSNVGSAAIHQYDDRPEARHNAMMEALRQTFRPEFLNRVDEVIVFAALTREQIGQIVELQLARLAGRLAERGIALRLTEQARARLAEEGYDPVYGARPLKRVIQQRILDPLALQVLEGRFRTGDTVEVDADGTGFVFRRAEERAPAAAAV
jgi:ATP-dependent Clp protease ATP-binding subunit ClpB